MNKQKFDSLRKAKHLTLEQLSEKTDISVSTLTKISAGYIDTSFQNMCRIADALECALDDLTDRNYQSVSAEEIELLQKYRDLTPYGQNVANALLDMNLLHQKNNESASGACHEIMCMEPTVYHGDAFSPGCYIMAPYTVHDDSLYGKADFAVHIPFHDLSPVFCHDDIVFLRRSFPKNGEIGMFQNKQKVFFSRCFEHGDHISLQQIQIADSPKIPFDRNSLNCFGTVFAIKRQCTTASGSEISVLPRLNF